MTIRDSIKEALEDYKEAVDTNRQGYADGKLDNYSQVLSAAIDQISSHFLSLIDSVTSLGETDATGINRFHEDGIINPEELKHKIKEQ